MSENSVDWTAQWEAFAPNFYDGKAHIDLAPHGELLLEPGGGFGDLSHPTTRLMIALMRPLVSHQIVLDIGCGSGILSLAALLLGAKQAYGIDIDEMALLHAKLNAKLNKLDKKSIFSKQFLKTKRKGQPSIILMNMIFSEQKEAFYPSYSSQQLITSGILREGRERYLEWITARGWTLIEEKEEDEWLGFVFHNLNPMEPPC